MVPYIRQVGTDTRTQTNLYALIGHISARTRAICTNHQSRELGSGGNQRTMLIRRFQGTVESEMSASSSNSEFNKHIPIYVRGIGRADV